MQWTPPGSRVLPAYARPHDDSPCVPPAACACTEAFERERSELLESLERCSVQAAELHRLDWESRKRGDEVRELQKVRGRGRCKAECQGGGGAVETGQQIVCSRGNAGVGRGNLSSAQGGRLAPTALPGWTPRYGWSYATCAAYA